MSDRAVDNTPMQSTPAWRGAMHCGWAAPLLVVAFAGSGHAAGSAVSFSDTLDVGGTGPPMVAVSGGSFEMGCNPENPYPCPVSLGPFGEIDIAPFAVSKYEVTFDDYDRYLEATGGSGRSDEADDEGWGRGARPVINVMVAEVLAYTEWLSTQTGERYRLPSEPEWEYVARAGTRTAYSWGNEAGEGNANCEGCGSRWGGETTAPVGSFPANPWGIHDMNGNVAELVQGCWYAIYLAGNRVRATPRWTRILGGRRCPDRTVRGGSWTNDSTSIRAAARGWTTWERYGSIFGIRVAREHP